MNEIVCPFCNGKGCTSCGGIGKIRVRKLKGDPIKDLTPTIEEIDRFIRTKDYYEKYLPEIEKLKKQRKENYKNKENNR